MKRVKKNIASLLLLGFLFPQIANAFHYYVIPHTSFSEDPGKVLISGTSYEYHSCDYHLSGFKFLAPIFEHSGKYLIPVSGQEVSRGTLIFHLGIDAFPFSVRGPPQIS